MRVKLEALTKKFPTMTAVDQLDLVFEEGELTALLGPSGCGKSTTLNMLAGILSPSEGKIYFDDKEVTNLPPQERGIGLVFQNYALYPHMTVLENICFPLEIQKVPKEQRIARAMEMAKLVKIENYLNRKPKELSGGQQQRVAIARALIKKPKLLLLDEPLSNLDARLRLAMREEIRRIQKETKITTIFVTHDQEEAMSISDKIVLLNEGKKMQEASPQEVYLSPANLFVANFIGNPPMNNIKGTVREGTFYSSDGEISIPLHHFKTDNYENVTLGLRAEAFVYDADNPSLVAEVLDSFRVGKEELITILIGKEMLRIYLSEDVSIQAGMKLPLRLRFSSVFLFDEKGKRL